MGNYANKSVIRLSAVSKRFKSQSASVSILEKADFAVNFKETIAVIGASGIGKSTFLNIIGGLDPPDSGQVMFYEQNLFAMSEDKLARFRNFRVGFVFQFHHLLRGFSALENVMIPGLIAKESKKMIGIRAASMLEKVGLDARLDHRVEDLSGGEQQRVAIARALVMTPDILLADEPTGNLDQITSGSIHDLLKKLNIELGMTMIVVTHNVALARMMDRQVTISNGAIVPV